MNQIKAQRLSWFGHLHRMPEERMVKKVYKWKPILTRPLGRPKNRWEDDIINDMRKLKIKNWTSYIQDRNKWKLYVEMAKTFKGWSSAWRRRRRSGIVPFFRNFGFRWGGSSALPPPPHRPLFARERTPVPIEREAGWALKPVWAVVEKRKTSPCRSSTPDPSLYCVFSWFRYVIQDYFCASVFIVV